MLYFSPMVESHALVHNVAFGAHSGERRSFADDCVRMLQLLLDEL